MIRHSRSIAAALGLCVLLQGSGSALAQTTLPNPTVPIVHSVTVTGQTAGPTPFIANIQMSTDSIGTLKSVAFEVTPKALSVTRPVSAVYLTDYLTERGNLNAANGTLNVPVFGLYSEYINTVTLTTRFQDGTVYTNTVSVTTPPFVDPFGYNAPEVLIPRTADKTLSYDYIMLKAHLGLQSPVIIDTDSEVRWVGTDGESFFSSIFVDNSFFVASTPPGATAQTGLTREELDGTYEFLADYAPDGVTLDDHHNLDPGKTGMLLPINTAVDLECIVLEVGTAGNIISSWNLADIISDAMVAGGDDPTQFVARGDADWFHNNANAYRKSDDTIIVSSRENFVIALDYSTGTIKWILGDPTKKWYEFASLRQYALTVPEGSLPPIGQHAISITHDDDLLLFDNGKNSAYQMPAGASRTYSSPRKYQLDLVARTATEVWNYEANQAVESPITSSVYEDDPSNYFINYAYEYYNNTPTFAELVGLDPTGKKIYDYRYDNNVPAFAWNAIPIHIEHLVFTGPVSALAPGHPKFFTGEVALANGVYYLEFPGNGNAFGYYSYLSDPGYIYHFDLGYEYIFDTYDSTDGVYLYDFASGHVFYTSPQFPFPYLYDFTLNAVLYFVFDAAHPGTSSPRMFYNFSTGKYITM